MKFVSRFFPWVLTCVLAFGYLVVWQLTVRSNQRAFDAAAAYEKQRVLSTHRHHVEQMWRWKALPVSDGDVWPGWHSEVKRISQLVADGVAFTEARCTTMLKFSFEDFGVTQADLAAFEIASDKLALGQSYDELAQASLCDSRCGFWSACRLSGAPDKGRQKTDWDARTEALDAFIVDFTRFNVTEILLVEQKEDGNVATEVPLTPAAIERIRLDWHVVCVEGLSKELLDYPEIGRDDASPATLFATIREHYQAVLRANGESMKPYDEEFLKANVRLAYLREGNYWVRWLRRKRATDEFVYPNSKDTVLWLHGLAREAGMDVRSFNTTVAELNALSGRDPEKLRRVVSGPVN